ncbi:MAG: hypothetical protein ACRD3B_12295 [Candidatus Sulfotelmatobacter sp.]
MFRVLGVFLLVFWLLSIILHLDATADVFGVVALVCLTADLAMDSRQQQGHARHHKRSATFL